MPHGAPKPAAQSESPGRTPGRQGSASWAEPAFWLTLGLMGVAAAYDSLGPELMVGNRVEIRSATGDTAVGMAGFRYFVNDDWHFPLLLATKLDAPDGTVVAFTDSIPLLALVAKSFRGLGIGVERWWGLWFTSIFVCQSLAGGWAIRNWSGSRFVAPLLAVPLLLVFPPLLQRMFHPALAFQAPLLMALGLAACFGRDERRRWWWLAVVLPVGALLIHPYHVLPVLVVLSGGLIDAWRAGRVEGRYLWSWAGSGAAALVVVAVVGGYLWQEPAWHGWTDRAGARSGRTCVDPRPRPGRASVTASGGRSAGGLRHHTKYPPRRQVLRPARSDPGPGR